MTCRHARIMCDSPSGGPMVAGKCLDCGHQFDAVFRVSLAEKGWQNKTVMSDIGGRIAKLRTHQKHDTNAAIRQADGIDGNMRRA